MLEFNINYANNEAMEGAKTFSLTGGDLKDMIPDSVEVDKAEGYTLGGKETCEHGETIEFYHGFDVKEIPIADVTRCKVVVLVTVEQDGKYYVDNVIECSVGESVPFVYNE